LYVPAEQRSQVATECPQPTMHSQAEAPTLRAGECEFARHSTQNHCPLDVCDPAKQLTQRYTSALSVFEVDLGSQSTHACGPALFLYLPGAQAAQLPISPEKPARHLQPTVLSLPGAESAFAPHDSQRDRSSDA